MITESKLPRKHAAPAPSTTRDAKRPKVTQVGKSVEPAPTTDVDM